MKKIYILFAVLCAINFYGQQKVAATVQERLAAGTIFRHFSPLEETNDIAPASKAVKEATYAIVNLEEIKGIAASKHDNIELTVPYNNSTITVQLYRVEIAAEGFHIDTNKQTAVNYERGAHYRGIIAGDATSLASFNFFEGEMNGIISGTQYNNIVVGKLQRAGNTKDYIIYSDAKLNILNDFTCSVSEPAVQENSHRNSNGTNDTNSTRCVTVYFELDHELFLANSSDITLTGNWMFSVFNNVQTLFANDGITTAMKSVFIWTVPDPYFGETSADYLFQFFEQRPVFDGDVGQLLGIDEGGLGGVAIDVAGLCSENNFSYSDVNLWFETVPLFSWTIQVITHELGHLLGSLHTHGCHWNGNNTAIDGCGSSAGFEEGNCGLAPIPQSPAQGTIMSYCHLVEGVGVNLANGFGPQPAARILQHVNSSSCLSTDCVNTCINTVATITTTATGTDSATISWVDEVSSGPWEVSVTQFSGTFTSWQTTTESSFTFMGLDANTYYKFAVRPVCTQGGALSSSTNELIFATTADFCAGAIFTDTGGSFNDYTNNQYLVWTITPNSEGAEAAVSFTAFNLELDFDFMFVYNGADTNAPLIGMFTGNDIPGPFTSTAPDGSLTFEFISDQFLTESGWVASISCANLSDNSYDITEFTYYPNPAADVVHIKAGEDMQELLVYNVAGQLLIQKTIGATETAVDVSAFAKGVYIFMVNSGDKKRTFRIVKQ